MGGPDAHVDLRRGHLEHTGRLRGERDAGDVRERQGGRLVGARPEPPPAEGREGGRRQRGHVGGGTPPPQREQLGRTAEPGVDGGDGLGLVCGGRRRRGPEAEEVAQRRVAVGARSGGSRHEREPHQLARPGVGGGGAGRALAGLAHGGHLPRQARRERELDVQRQRDHAGGRVDGRGVLHRLLVPVLGVPGTHIDAGVLVEVQLVPGAVERQPRLHQQLAGERRAGGARLRRQDVEAPHHAGAVEPGVVEPHLAARVALCGLEVVGAEQHAELVADRQEGVHRQDGAVLARAHLETRREVGGVGHGRPPQTSPRTSASRWSRRACVTRSSRFAWAATAAWWKKAARSAFAAAERLAA